MANEMDGGSPVGILGALAYKLLNPVLAAAVHSGGNGLADRVRVVHFGGGTELHFLGITARCPGGILHFLANPGDIFGDGHGVSFFL